ncbi:MAG: HlyD family secretion protein, partial [Myxococcales bacterium]|nr:HlyD family secretion protein [Myxococcales bacterium]
VRHAFNARERRPMQKGDGAPAGTHVLSIAKDEKLAVRFFVPEARIARIKVGAKVRVWSNQSKDKVLGVIREIEPFPQQIGFLLDDETLPNAQETAYAVLAEFVGEPGASLQSGTEAKVRLE